MEAIIFSGDGVMISFIMNGTNHAMPLTMLLNLGHNQKDRTIASAILLQNSWLFRTNPTLAMYLKLL